MLQHLFIQNYTLINHLDIQFYDGFTAITGETGAGKSILMDALDLVLGKRADTQVLLDPGRKCIVEGTFSTLPEYLVEFFEDNNLDHEEKIILRREISPNGKSRAFINDTPVNLNILKSLGDLLVDIHAQNATTSLQDPVFQLSVIDSYAGNDLILETYQDKYHQLNALRKTLIDYILEEEEASKRLDYNQFLLDELVAANLEEHEQEDLEIQFNLITHAEEIKRNLFRIMQILYVEEGSVIGSLSEMETDLRKISDYHPDLAAILNRLSSDLIDLKEIHRELSSIDQGIGFNPDQLAEVQQRLDLIYHLQQKHHVRSCRELIQIREQLAEEIIKVNSLENRIISLKKEIESIDNELSQLAATLSNAREKHFAAFSGQVSELLKHMGMPDGRFEVSRERLVEKNLFGEDKIEFYFNANIGYSLRPLAEIASGGELSRVMLAVKSLVSAKKMLPTIVFDEIDNGLSGDIAGRVGDILTRLASGIQVIVITHMPQIAGKADHQYTVFKEVRDSMTYSKIELLDQHGRLTELARMIGGKDTTAAAVAAARELLAPASGITDLFKNN